MDQIELDIERNLVDNFLREVMQTNPKATYGEVMIRQALNQGAVSKLLLSEGINNLDLIDELTILAGHTSADVSIISMDSEEGATLKNSFGGIAAILRYSIT